LDLPVGFIEEEEEEEGIYLAQTKIQRSLIDNI